MIKFICSHCGKDVSTSDGNAGKKGKCPTCKGLVDIPSLAVACPAHGKNAITTRDLGCAAPRKEAALRPVKAAQSGRAGRPHPAPSKTPPALRRPQDEDEVAYEASPVEDEELPVVEAAEEGADDVEVVEPLAEQAPRRRKRRRSRAGKWADCPECGARGDATRAVYTLWGGFVGPLLLSHVRCNRCGTGYNGKHGDYNTVRILIMYGVSLGIGFALGLIGVILGH
jgi:hypothetical protein